MAIDIIVLLSFLISVVIAIYLYKDAKNRNYDALGAALLGLALGIIGLIIWLFIRGKK